MSMNEIIFAQLATAIDAEGSISIIRHRKTKWCNYCPMIQIVNKSKEWLEYFKSGVSGFRKIQPIKWKDRTYYRLDMRKIDKVCDVLKHILPYLIIKKYRAELVIEFCESRLKNSKLSYSEHELELRKEVFLINITGRGHLKRYEKDVCLITKHEGYKLRERDSKGHFRGSLACPE